MRVTEYWQTYYPVHAEWKNPGKGDEEAAYGYGDESFIKLLYDGTMAACDLKEPEEEFDLEASDRFPPTHYASNPPKLRFLEFLIRLSGARRALELGAFIGISGLYFAKALPEDGELITVEKFDHFAEIAQRNFTRNGMAEKIKLHQADAMSFVSTLTKDEVFDFIFIDGDKGNYLPYFQALEPHLSKKGVMVVDDVFFHGDAMVDTPLTDKGQGVRDLLKVIENRDDLVRSMLPVGGGGIMLLMRK